MNRAVGNGVTNYLCARASPLQWSGPKHCWKNKQWVRKPQGIPASAVGPVALLLMTLLSTRGTPASAVGPMGRSQMGAVGEGEGATPIGR
jgi:hypothetical protein